MTVVRMLWEHVDRVQLSAARLNEVMEGWGQLTNVGEEILSIAMRMCPTMKFLSGWEDLVRVQIPALRQDLNKDRVETIIWR